MRERPKHLEKAVADPRNEEPASPLRSETALKDQAERVAALRRALLAPWHACPGLPLPRGVHGPYQKRPCRKKWSGKALRSLILATLLFGINTLWKPSRAGSVTGVVPPASRSYPARFPSPVQVLPVVVAPSSATLVVCRRDQQCTVVHLCPFLAPADTTQGRGKERSMGRWGPGASASSLGFQDVIAPRSEEQDLSCYTSCCPRRFWT